MPFGKSQNVPFTTLGSKGGEVEHKLTIEEMPRHNHDPVNYNGGKLGFNSGTGGFRLSFTSGSDHGYFKTSHVGGDKPHNNMPPYVVINYEIVAS